jgi:hypothetical protein
VDSVEGIIEDDEDYPMASQTAMEGALEVWILELE